jgi:hypothetical protein
MTVLVVMLLVHLQVPTLAPVLKIEAIPQFRDEEEDDDEYEHEDQDE